MTVPIEDPANSAAAIGDPWSTLTPPTDFTPPTYLLGTNPLPSMFLAANKPMGGIIIIIPAVVVLSIPIPVPIAPSVEVSFPAFVVLWFCPPAVDVAAVLAVVALVVVAVVEVVVDCVVVGVVVTVVLVVVGLVHIGMSSPIGVQIGSFGLQISSSS
jgi:hypothetical protein